MDGNKDILYRIKSLSFSCSKNDLKMEIFHMKIKAQSKTTFDSRHISITNDSITYLLLIRFNFLEFNYAVRSTRDLNQRSISKAKLTGHGLFHFPDHLGLRHFPIHHSQRPLRQSLDSRWRFGRTRIPLHARLGKIEV